MKPITFDIIWTECYEKAGIALLNFFSENIRDKYDFKCDFSKDAKQSILRYYEQNREKLKNDYFFFKRDPEHLIDKHKIGACLAKAILDLSPMSFSKDRNIPWLMKASNQALAFYTSVNLISILLDAFYLRENIDLSSIRPEQTIIHYPITTAGHEPYSVGVIKTLVLNDYYNNEFDLLAFADRLYWIEHFNRQIIENNINPAAPILH